MPTDVELLTDGLHVLPHQDQAFATSLLTQLAKKGSLSSKQWYWVKRLADQTCKKPEPEVETSQVGDLTRVYQMFDRAKQKVKYPAIVLAGAKDAEAEKPEFEIRLYVAGPMANVPGSLTVKDEREGSWLGRIHEDGKFEHSRKTPPTRPMLHLLERFAQDPELVAKESALLTGKCCFCNSVLTDPKSTGVGYGPVCAKKFGMAWGVEKAELTCS